MLGGFAQYIVPLLYDNFESVEWVENFEIDQDVKRLSYKFNKRLKEDKKYQIIIKNVMFDKIQSAQHAGYNGSMDTIINCSCEHMYPMWKFRDLNKTVQKNSLYILQSSDDDQHDDHINCVQSEDELIDQARIKHVMYSGSKILSNKSTRFMVIGRMNPVEWCRKNDIWYLKMDLEIPEVIIKEAQAVYDEGFFVEHRLQDGDEWWSSGLHGFVYEDESDTSLGWP